MGAIKQRGGKLLMTASGKLAKTCGSPAFYCCDPDYAGNYDVNVSGVTDWNCSDCDTLSNGLFTVTPTGSCRWEYSALTGGCAGRVTVIVEFSQSGANVLLTVTVRTEILASIHSSAGIFTQTLGAWPIDCSTVSASLAFSSQTNVGAFPPCMYSGASVTMDPS